MRTKMKTSLVILLYMVLFLGTTVAATSGTLVLRGYVPERADLVILNDTLSSSVSLDSESGRTQVGTIKENSTKTTGYTVEISSRNAASSSEGTPYLTSSDSDETIGYDILFGDEVVALDHGVGHVQNSDYTMAGNIAIAYEAGSLAETSSRYSDILTLSVIAN